MLIHERRTYNILLDRAVVYSFGIKKVLGKYIHLVGRVEGKRVKV